MHRILNFLQFQKPLGPRLGGVLGRLGNDLGVLPTVWYPDGVLECHGNALGAS